MTKKEMINRVTAEIPQAQAAQLNPILGWLIEQAVDWLTHLCIGKLTTKMTLFKRIRLKAKLYELGNGKIPMAQREEYAAAVLEAFVKAAAKTSQTELDSLRAE